MRLPTYDEIADRAEVLGLDPITDRAHVVKAILEDEEIPEGKPAGLLLSRNVVQVADGHLVVEVSHYPEGTAT